MDDRPLPTDASATRLPMLRIQVPAMSFDAMWQLAQSVAKSGLFGMKTADQALVLMSIAQAEGRHPALAARDYDIINGRPSKKAEAMLRDFLSGGGHVEWLKLEDATVEATFSHPSGGSATIRWDMDRANRAGLGGNSMYAKYPRQMLRSRVVSEGVRTVWPMATSGFYVPEEVGEFATEVVDVTPRPAGTKLEQFETRHRNDPSQAELDGQEERANRFEQRHAPGVYDAETGEVAKRHLTAGERSVMHKALLRSSTLISEGEVEAPLNDAAWLAAGDAVSEKGEAEFKAWWNSLGKELITRMGGQKGKLFQNWRTRAKAADERSGPEPGEATAEQWQGEANMMAQELGQSLEAATDERPAPLSPALGNRSDAANVSDRPQSKEIAPVMHGGKPDWRAWWIALCAPKLRQYAPPLTSNDLADFLGDNEPHLNAARIVLGAKYIDDAIAEQWGLIG